VPEEPPATEGRLAQLLDMQTAALNPVQCSCKVAKLLYKVFCPKFVASPCVKGLYREKGREHAVSNEVVLSSVMSQGEVVISKLRKGATSGTVGAGCWMHDVEKLFSSLKNMQAICGDGLVEVFLQLCRGARH
jgi:hypothetical protein